MPPRISKRVREEAAMLCSAAASWTVPVPLREVLPSFGLTPKDDAAWLAVRAWAKAWDDRASNDIEPTYAEAECLLRTFEFPKEEP